MTLIYDFLGFVAASTMVLGPLWLAAGAEVVAIVSPYV